MVPLAKDKFAIGQIISLEKNCMDSVLCVFFSRLLDQIPDAKTKLDNLNIISVQITTRDLLDNGKWKVFSSGDILNISDVFPIERLRNSGYIGAIIEGSGVIRDFLEAFHGLAFWDQYADARYFDNLLISGVCRPTDAVFSK